VLRSSWFTELSAGSFFQRVNGSGWADLQHPCCIADAAAIETHVHDLLFDRGGTSFVEEITLKAITRTGGVLALIALLTRFGLAAFDDLVAVTVGTKHGNQYHDALLPKLSAGPRSRRRPLSATQHNPTTSLVGYHFIAMRHESLCQVFCQLLSL
jgi:hypothetical protein